MKKKNKQFNPVSEGLKRIDDIKNTIAACRTPKLARAQVYEIWQDIFELEEN